MEKTAMEIPYEEFIKSTQAKQYTTVEELRKAINEYFNSLSCVAVTYDRKHSKNIPLYGADGEPIKGWKKHPTKSGLARYLGLSSRDVLDTEYKGKDKFRYVVECAYLIIEEYTAEQSFNAQSQFGSKHILASEFGWSFKDTGPKKGPTKITIEGLKPKTTKKTKKS